MDMQRYPINCYKETFLKNHFTIWNFNFLYFAISLSLSWCTF